jgi:prophage regulatory protein
MAWQKPSCAGSLLQTAHRPGAFPRTSFWFHERAHRVTTELTNQGLRALTSEHAEIGECPSVAPAFFRLRDVLRITALSRPTLYRRIAAQRFPAPVHLGGRASGWAFASLQNWINDPEGYRAPALDVVAAPRRRGRPRKYSAG